MKLAPGYVDYLKAQSALETILLQPSITGYVYPGKEMSFCYFFILVVIKFPIGAVPSLPLHGHLLVVVKRQLSMCINICGWVHIKDR